MIIPNEKSKREPRIRYHISEETSAELAHARREDGFNSWKDFFANLLQCRLKAHAEATPPERTKDVQEELKSLCQRVGRFETKQELHLALTESNEETLQTMQQELTEALEVFRRMANLLNRAMNEETGPPVAPGSGNDVLNSVRRKKFSQ